MARLRHIRCGKRETPSFLYQLVGVSGWKGTLLQAIGSLAATLTGVALLYRIPQMILCFNVYFTLFQSIKIGDSNLTDNDKSFRNETHNGIDYNNFNDFVESTEHTSNIYFTLGAISVVTSFLQIFTWEYVNTANVAKLRHVFFSQVLRQDMAWHEQLKKGSDLNSRLSVDLERVRNNLGSKTSMLIFSTACILASPIFIFQMHWILGLIALIGIAITSVFTLISGKLLAKQVRKEQENDRRIGNVVTEVLTTFKIVKSFAHESREAEKFSRLLKTGREYSKIKHIICSIHSAFSLCSIYSLVTAFLCLGVRLIDDQAISPGEYCIGYFCIVIASLSSGNLVPIATDVVEAAASFSNLLSLKDVLPDIDPMSDSGLRPEQLKSDILFQDVTFSYPKRMNSKALDGLTMRIPQGKCVALVGPSGTGKSTVFDLLLRLRDPDSGKITIGDADIKNMNVDFLRKHIGIVTQEPVLFDTTIEENIRYGNLAASPADIIRAAKLVNAHDFIMKLPYGYKTMVGERGGNLSGGQKQRVAIARALVRDPDILLLDEATSALDSHSERVVQEALERVMKGRTTIVVAHRLSTICQADLIYVLKDGFVHEHGTHSELMLKLGVYYSMQSRELSRRAVQDPEANANSYSADQNVSALEFSASSNKQMLPEANLVIAPDETGLVSKKHILALLLRWKSIVSLIFSMIGALHGPVFSFTFYLTIIQCFKEPLHDVTKDLYSNGLSMIYFDVGLGVAIFIAVLSASIAMEDTVEYLRSGMFRKILNRDMYFFDRTESKATQLANDIIQKPGQLKNIAGSKASGVVTAITLISAALIASFIGFWQLTLVQCLFFIFVAAINIVHVKLKLKLQSFASARLKMGSKQASECFDNIKTVHCLSLQKEMIDSYTTIFKASKEELLDNIMYAAVYAILTSVSHFFLGMTVAVGMKIPSDDGISSFDYLLISTYNLQVALASVAALIIYHQDFGQSKQSVAESIAQAHAGNPKELEPSEKPVLKGKIEFKDVHFSYLISPGYPVLRGFNLTVHSGQTVALVGSSGHGKSTVINLLEKFYAADRGKIVIDGADIRDIDTQYLRDNMSLVTQEPLLFNTTIRENILYGAKAGSQISEETLFKCCQQANIYDFIMGLPERFETTVGARGSQLSGGQRQRIAIARALIREPKILLLDEATSALDSESEKEVLDALDRVAQGRTTIVIAHRLSTIRHADLIVVMENGTVKEKGGHEELVKLKGRYYEMLQFKS